MGGAFSGDLTEGRGDMRCPVLPDGKGDDFLAINDPCCSSFLTFLKARFETHSG